MVLPCGSREVACHKLNLDPSFPPVQQKRRKISSAVAEAVNQEEVDRLLEAKFIRPETPIVLLYRRRMGK